jgi:hypothetical protein
MDISSANAPHIVMRCTGEMLTDPLLRSIELLTEHHDVLNSSIETIGEKLCLVGHPQKTVAFREVVAAGITAHEKENEAYRIANDMVWEEYDLDNGPLYRVFLVRISALEYIIGVALHHTIGDMISIGIMFQELFTIYGSVMNGTPIQAQPTRLRYMDYLASMENWSVSAGCEEHIRYWKYVLKSAPVTELSPVKSNRPLNGMILESTAEMNMQLDEETSRSLKRIAIQLKTTLFTVLLAIYKIALLRVTGQEEPVVIALHAGRLDAGFQNVIGDFALEVAYKTCLRGNPGFTEIVGRIMRAMNEANAHQPVPLDWVRCALAKEEVSFCAPGINFISGDTVHAQNPSASRRLNFNPPGVRHGCHGFPVSCAMELRDGDGVINGSMVYRNGFYDESAIQAFMNCFIRTASDVIREGR